MTSIGVNFPASPTGYSPYGGKEQAPLNLGTPSPVSGSNKAPMLISSGFPATSAEVGGLIGLIEFSHDEQTFIVSVYDREEEPINRFMLRIPIVSNLWRGLGTFLGGQPRPGIGPDFSAEAVPEHRNVYVDDKRVEPGGIVIERFDPSRKKVERFALSRSEGIAYIRSASLFEKTYVRRVRNGSQDFKRYEVLGSRVEFLHEYIVKLDALLAMRIQDLDNLKNSVDAVSSAEKKVALSKTIAKHYNTLENLIIEFADVSFALRQLLALFEEKGAPYNPATPLPPQAQDEKWISDEKEEFEALRLQVVDVMDKREIDITETLHL